MFISLVWRQFCFHIHQKLNECHTLLYVATCEYSGGVAVHDSVLSICFANLYIKFQLIINWDKYYFLTSLCPINYSYWQNIQLVLLQMHFFVLKRPKTLLWLTGPPIKTKGLASYFPYEPGPVPVLHVEVLQIGHCAKLASHCGDHPVAF